MQSWPLGDGFRPLRIFRRIAAENPKYSRKVFCQKKDLHIWVFWGQNMDFSRQKRCLAPVSAELPQSSATHNPKRMQNWPNFAWLSNRSIFLICPKFLSFCLSKKAPNVAKGGFSDRWHKRLPANSQQKSVKCGNGLKWETAGAALALLWQQCGWPTTLQSMGVVEIACAKDAPLPSRDPI